MSKSENSVVKKELHLYLLRGLTRESGHWGSFVDMLNERLPQAKIHFLDLPGVGKHYRKKAPASITKMVEFMRRQHIKELQAENRTNVICASSLGGMLAVDWSIRHKDDFSGLVMIASSFKNLCTFRERVNPRVRWDLLKILFSPSIVQREKLIIGINSNKPEKHASLAKEWIKIQRKRTMTWANILRQTIAGMRYGLKDKKPEAPILIIGSKGDKLVCPECIKKSQKYLGGTLVWHESSGHGIPLDEPEWLSQQISNWCQKQFV